MNDWPATPAQEPSSLSNCENKTASNSPLWTQRDAFFSKLFHPWEDMPSRDIRKETKLLRALDEIITKFEAHIQYSDSGFWRWVCRHQRAMELGLAPVPTWPKLHRTVKGKEVWVERAWNSRYLYLVRERARIAKARLAETDCFRATDLNHLLEPGDIKQFQLFKQSAKLYQSKNRAERQKSMKAGPLWFMPLNCLLALLCGRTLDLATVEQQFWNNSQGKGLRSMHSG